MNFTKLLPLIGLAISAPAAAVNFNTSIGVSLTATGGSIYCNTTTCNTTGVSGPFVTLTAYSTSTVAPNATTSPVDTGNWVNAQIAIYGGGGVGITSVTQSMPPEGVQPQHAIDNNTIDDILVVDFGSNNWDVSSFSLGYVCTIDSAGTGCTAANSVNVSAWVGGTQALNFNNVAFADTAASPGTSLVPYIATAGQAFTELTLSPDPGGTGVRTDVSNPNNVLGRYLIITGDLAGYTDAFKVSGIVATQSTGVPLPGTLPLLGLGLAALGFGRKRRT